MKLKKLNMMVFILLVCIPFIFADTVQFGNQFQSREFSSSAIINTNRHYCREEVFFKDGVIDGVYLPAQIGTGSTALITIRDSKEIGALYTAPYTVVTGKVETYDFINTTDFSVTAGQKLWVCIYQNETVSNSYKYQSAFTITQIFGSEAKGLPYMSYGNEQSYTTDTYGWWTGLTFPLNPDLEYTGRIRTDGGYQYTDGTGNIVPYGTSLDNLNKVTTVKHGEYFYFPYNNRTLYNITMLSSRGGADVNYRIVIGYNASNTAVIGQCEKSSVATLNAYPNSGMVTCDLSSQNITLDSGMYYVYLRCMNVSGTGASCGGTNHIMYFDTETRTTQNPTFIDMGSWDGNRSCYLTNAISPLDCVNRDNDIFFSLGIDAEATNITQCNDDIDNDGDGYTDLSDPQCSAPTDTNESPFDYTECNDGLDNDFDGFVDLDDPSCDLLTDTTESPSDTVQKQNVCLVEEFCILDEKFPYNDNISNHGWYGDITDGFYTENYLGSKKLKFGSGVFDFYLDEVNENVYDTVQVWFDLFLELGETWDYSNNTFYIILKDESDREAIKLKFLLRRNATIDPNAIEVSVSTYNGSDYIHIVRFVSGFNADSLLRVNLEVDQTLKTFVMNFQNTNGLTEGIIDYGWSDVLATKLNVFGISHNDYDPNKMKVHIDNIQIFGSDISYDTICDEFSPPTYLKETFNGYLRACDWVTSVNIWADNFLFLSQSTTSFFAKKDLVPLALDTSNRYVTLKYDLNVIDITTGSTITFRLYDDDNYNFFTVFNRDSGEELFYNEDGTGKVSVSSIPLGEMFTYFYVIDLNDDTFDIYFNGTIQTQDAGFSNEFANIENIKTFKVSSNNAEYNLDNVHIYASDSSGVQILPDDEDSFEIIESNTFFCDLFSEVETECINDEDCDFGICTGTNICSSFDYTYCDENQKQRGMGCIVSAVTVCTLESTGNIILDNFFLFLIFLVILIIIVYFFVMLKK